MERSVRRRVTGAAAIGTAAMLMASAWPASAGTGPAWHITTIIGAKRAANLLSMVATGPRSAFAFGYGGRKSRPLALRWDGTSWRPGGVPGASAQALRVSATSPGNVWAAGGLCEGGPGGAPFSSYLARWNGTGWATTHFTHINWCLDAIVTVGARNGWLFTSEPLALHLRGGRWRPVTLPGGGPVVTAAALSASDVWAFAYKFKTIALRWDGSRWRTVPVPSFRTRRGKHLYPWASYASSATGLWVSVSDVPGPPNQNSVLLHRTGGSWRMVPVPGGAVVADITGDGAGGLWCIGFGRGVSKSLMHYSAGTWTSYPIPTAGLPAKPSAIDQTVYSIASIPGTTSVWATGQAQFYNSKDQFQNYTVIYKYGP